ncbi:MAG: hypothetical protein J0G94_05370 [Sphingomonadales bacterium]|nr:hypothetical protein [Sphingomonadales bacterium]
MARLRKFAWVFIVIEVLAIILSQHRVVEDIAKGFGAVHAALGGWWFWSLVSAICLA